MYLVVFRYALKNKCFVSKKLKWYPLFEHSDELEALFAYRSAVVHRGVFGEVLLVKNKSGYHAFENRCPHQNNRLDNCTVTDEHVICPFHQYHFSCETGRGHGLYLEKYELKIENDHVFLGKEVWRLF